MASAEECIHKCDGRGVLLTHNEADFRLQSKPLVEAHDVQMVQVDEEVKYTTVCLDNASRLPFLNQAQKLLCIPCLESKDCPLSFSRLGVSCDKLEKQGSVVIRCASRTVETSTNSSNKPRLSQEAIAEIRSIENIAMRNKYKTQPNEIKQFLETFGSHFIHGSLEKLSSFQWVVTAEKHCEADLLREIAEEVFQTCQRQPHHFAGSNSGIWYDISSFLDTSDWKLRKKVVLRFCKLRVMHNNNMDQNITFSQWLHMTPKTQTEQSPSVYKNAESVKPVWNLIEESYLEFQRANCLAEFFEATWQELADETNHLEKQATPKPIKIKSTADVVDLRTMWMNLLKDIGMEKYFPCKLPLHDVMALDCHSSKSSSFNEIAWDMLKRVVMVDNRFLEKPLLDYIKEMELKTTPKQKIAYPHPMDVMLLLFHASDFMLRQVLAKKLFMCRKAIPFIIPTETDQMQMLLWPLRSIVMEWKNNDMAMEESIIKHPITRVTFIKLGQSDFSKSVLINDILSENRHRVFLTRESGVLAKRIISNGMVEMAHYSPAGKEDDIFPRTLLHFNLRGDACKYPKQVAILSELSHVLVIIFDIKDISNKAVEEKLSSASSCRTIVLLTNMTHLDEDILDEKREKAVDLFEKLQLEHVFEGFNDDGKCYNQSQIVRDLREAVNEVIPKGIIQSLEDSVNFESHKGIIDETSNKACMEGKMLSEKLVKEMKSISKENIKEILLPLQGQVCKEMGSLLRQQSRDKNHKQKEEAKEMIVRLRRQQNGKLNSEKSFVQKYFLQPKMDDVTRLFFTKWVKMALDEECRLHLPGLQADFNEKWKSLRQARKTMDPHRIKTAQTAYNYAEEKISAVGIGLEHILREIGQINEVSDNCEMTRELPKLASLLFISGYPLEIMDGDNGFIPMHWVTSVFKEVSVLVGSGKKIFVLSILGVQSSGKSTLLNSMLGLEFAVSAGRCTRGIYAQMLPVNKGRSPQIPFDYILVLDSEGLRAPELALQKFEHDNELATLVIGLADLSFINLKGENTAEIQDVLQIVVSAFLRMQRADSYKKRHCMFVHQNVSAVNAEEKMKLGQQKMQETLDEMTVQAAEALGLADRFTSFNDVISFEGDKDTLYFPDLWNGDPPMATVNTNYADKCVLVKKQILDGIAKSNPACITIDDFITRLQDLWKGVLADDFVFSFRNSLAAKAYISLEQECAKNRRQIESALSGWINKKCRIESGKCNTVQELHLCFQTILTELQQAAVEKVAKHIQDLEQFIDKHPQKDLLEQWKKSKLVSFKMAVESSTSRLKQQVSNIKAIKMVDVAQLAQHHHHEREITKKAMELAVQMREEQLSDRGLQRTFEDMWTIWSDDISPKDVEKGPTILSILHEMLIEMFQSDAEYMYLRQDMIKHKATTSEQKISLEMKDVELKSKSWFNKLLQWWKDNTDECNRIVNNIIMDSQVLVSNIVSVGEPFNNSHGQTVLHSIFKQFKEINSRQDDAAKFAFKPSAKAKVCLIVCDYAAEKFEKMNEEYERLHGVKAKVEAYKQKVFIMFQDTVKQRTTEKNAAEYLCTAIRPNIEEIVNTDMSRKVVDLILQDIGHVKFHLMMKIMLSFAETEHDTSDTVSSIKSYVTDAYRFARQWIQNHAECNLLFRGGKNETKYYAIAALHVNSILDCVREGIAQATKATEEDNAMGLMDWISAFCQHAQQEVSITPDELKDLENYEISNFGTFANLLEKRLVRLSSMIHERLRLITKDSVRWNGPNPYTEALNELWGCREQCPFCHEPCQRAEADHEANHVCVQHRPSGINGVHYKNTLMLLTPTCNMSVASNDTFDFSLVTGKDEDYHPYKEYNKFYPKWDIAPDDVGDASEYWKWIFCEYEEQIREWRSSYKLEIPTSWHSITKQQASDSLRVYRP